LTWEILSSFSPARSRVRLLSKKESEQNTGIFFVIYMIDPIYITGLLIYLYVMAFPIFSRLLAMANFEEGIAFLSCPVPPKFD
jgi:hypothetical protein